MNPINLEALAGYTALDPLDNCALTYPSATYKAAHPSTEIEPITTLFRYNLQTVESIATRLYQLEIISLGNNQYQVIGDLQVIGAFHHDLLEDNRFTVYWNEPIWIKEHIYLFDFTAF